MTRHQATRGAALVGLAVAPSSVLAAGAWLSVWPAVPRALGLLGLMVLGLALTALPVLVGGAGPLRRLYNAHASAWRALGLGIWLALIALAGHWAGPEDVTADVKVRAATGAVFASVADRVDADQFAHALLYADSRGQARLAGVDAFYDPGLGRLLPRRAAVEREPAVTGAPDDPALRAAAARLAESLSTTETAAAFATPPPRIAPLRLWVMHEVDARFAPTAATWRALDFVAAGLCALALAWAFSPSVAWLGLLFLLAGLGALRFAAPGLTLDGVCALVGALCFLRRGHGAAAGVCLAAGVLLDPVAGWFVVPVAVARAARRGHPGTLARVGPAALITLVGLWGVCAAGLGPGHAKAALGGAYASLVAPETTGWGLGGLVGSGPYGLLGPAQRALALLSVTLVWVYGWRTRRPAWQTMWLGWLPLFAFSAVSLDDLAFRVLFLAPWAASLRTPGRVWMGVVLLLPELLSYAPGAASGLSALDPGWALLLLWLVAAGPVAAAALQRRYWARPHRIAERSRKIMSAPGGGP